MNIREKIRGVVAGRRSPDVNDAEKQPDERKIIGVTGEKAAARFLSDRGFLILARNFRCPRGEIDIVARKCELIVFAEVKTRSSREWGDAEESVTRQKQDKIKKTAAHFVRINKLDGNNLYFRYDVFAVYVNERGRVEKIEHFPEAFGSL